MFKLIAEILEDLTLNGAMPAHKKEEILEKVDKLNKASNRFSEVINKMNNEQ